MAAPAISVRRPDPAEPRLTADRAAAPKRWLRPGWPLTVLFLAFPLWWLLGLRSFIFLFLTPPMALELARRRRVDAPRGFGLWLLYLAWVVAGLALLGAHVPGTKDGHVSTRLFSASYRIGWYIALTVVLLYVGNLKEHELPTRRIFRLLSVMFVITVIGGYLGMVAPHLQFRSPFERIVPGGISGNAFFKSVTHPVAAQVQDFLGYAEARPAAPYGHTNDWGANFGLFLPFFFVTWCRKDAGWRRWPALGLLALAAVPVVYSLNRGLWIGLTVMAAFLAIRAAVAGRAKMLLAVLAGAGVLTLAIVATPLGGLLQQRIATPHSNQAREGLSSRTVAAVAHGSPLVGFGSTRNVEGNFTTISGGATTDCPRCAPPALGTQGHAWLLIFSQGFVGAALFFGFVLRRFVPFLREHRPEAVTCLAAIVFFLVVMWVYDLLDAPLFTVMIAFGILWRLRRDRSAGDAAVTP